MGFLYSMVRFTFRALFVIALIGLGVKNFLDINHNIPQVQKNLKNIEDKLPRHHLLKQTFTKANTFIFEVMNVHSGLLFLTALLALFRFKLSKFTMFLYVVLELALKQTIIFQRDEQAISNALKYVSLFASVLYI